MKLLKKAEAVLLSLCIIVALMLQSGSSVVKAATNVHVYNRTE